jgi:hypothetical protein
MKVENLHKAASLAGNIERLESEIARYRVTKCIRVEADMGGEPSYNRRLDIYEGRFGDVEFFEAPVDIAGVRGVVLDMLFSRLDGMRAELRALGVTVDAAGDPGRQ